MTGVRLFGWYVSWHYGRAFADLWRVFGNIDWFLYHFFSIPLLLRTFFAPFERLSERYGGGFDLGYFFGSLIVNVIMRLVGMIVRAVVIAAGAVALVLALAAEALFVALWVVLPFFVAALFAWGIALVFSLA